MPAAWFSEILSDCSKGFWGPQYLVKGYEAKDVTHAIE